MRKSDLVEVFIRIIGILLFIQLIDQFDQLSWYNWKLILKIIVSMVLVLKAKWISYKLHQRDRHNMIIQGTLSPYTIYELAFLICGYLLWQFIFHLYSLLFWKMKIQQGRPLLRRAGI